MTGESFECERCKRRLGQDECHLTPPGMDGCLVLRAALVRTSDGRYCHRVQVDKRRAYLFELPYLPHPDRPQVEPPDPL